MSGIDWSAVGGAVVSLIIGAGGVALMWRQREVSNARQGAEVDVIQMMREQMTTLAERLALLERENRMQQRHIFKLERLMHDAGIVPPAFDPDGPQIDGA